MALLTSALFPTLAIFNASFQQPRPPTVATELSGIFMQHKWSAELSHITAGYWYNSASQAKVRVDETYAGGAHGSSLFDYRDANSDGAIMNHQVIVEPSIDSAPACFQDYVESPAFPLVTADLLQTVDATFGGVVVDPLIGEAQTWNFVFGGGIPVVVYLDSQRPPVLLGYDFWGSLNRTKVVTRFFAHQVGGIDAKVFEDFDCARNGEVAGSARAREEM